MGAEGRPHIVPICFALEASHLYFAVDEKPKRSKRLKRLANIQANPRVSVLVDEYDEDWSRLWWIRLDGVARILEKGPQHEQALALLTEKYEQYRLQPPTGPVVAIAIERSRAWAADPESFGEGAP